VAAEEEPAVWLLSQQASESDEKVPAGLAVRKLRLWAATRTTPGLPSASAKEVTIVESKWPVVKALESLLQASVEKVAIVQSGRSVVTARASLTKP
jgi:hypothetical protein